MRMIRSLSSRAPQRGNAVLCRPLFLAVLIGAAAAPAIAAGQTAVAPAGMASPFAGAVNTAPANGVGSAFELTFWQSIAGTDDPAAFDAYLVQYPAGTFSGLARARIAALQRAAPIPSVAQPAAAPPIAATAPASALNPTPAVQTTLAPNGAPAVTPGTLGAPVLAVKQVAVQQVAVQQMAAITTTNAALTPAEPSLLASSPASAAKAIVPSSPLSRLLAQLRGTGETAAAAASVPLVPPAPVPDATPAPAAPALVPVAAATGNYGSARPVMLSVSDVAMPVHFCSADARNLYHNAAYRPAVEAATRNNEAAVTYLRQLQQTYDRGQLGRDTAVLNAIAAEARAYQSEAARAYSVQAGLVRQFDTLMAVPLRPCTAGTQ